MMMVHGKPSVLEVGRDSLEYNASISLFHSSSHQQGFLHTGAAPASLFCSSVHRERYLHTGTHWMQHQRLCFAPQCTGKDTCLLALTGCSSSISLFHSSLHREGFLRTGTCFSPLQALLVIYSCYSLDLPAEWLCADVTLFSPQCTLFICLMVFLFTSAD